MATSCLRQDGAQIDTYKLSSCPSEEYVLPNFAETEGLILTQDPESNFKCLSFKAYTKMTKETIDPKMWDFLVKINIEKTDCTVQVMTRRLCLANQDCNNTPTDLERYLPNIKKIVSEFLFRDKNTGYLYGIVSTQQNLI